MLAFVQVTFTLLAHKQVLGKVFTNTFALLPMSTIGDSKIWNVVSAGFYEIDPLKCILNLMLFVTVGRWIETSWGASSFIAYLFVINLLSGICTYIFLFATYLFTRIDRFLYVALLPFLSPISILKSHSQPNLTNE